MAEGERAVTPDDRRKVTRAANNGGVRCGATVFGDHTDHTGAELTGL
ncbi:unannotated protein [freshwater metagenome]|uniref:Unannotated protein n=1 Tax=freshwater metagenome TaxID=449393 RepID=A0A6J6K2M9_9ZZZZ